MYIGLVTTPPAFNCGTDCTGGGGGVNSCNNSVVSILKFCRFDLKYQLCTLTMKILSMEGGGEFFQDLTSETSRSGPGPPRLLRAPPPLPASQASPIHPQRLAPAATPCVQFKTGR